MRSLFLKIFLSFWLSTAVIIGLFIVTSERPRAMEAHAIWHSMMSRAVSINAFAISRMYEERGCAQVLTYTSDARDSNRVFSFLFDQKGNQLCSNNAPENVRKAAAETLRTGAAEVSSPSEVPLFAQRETVPSGHTYVLITLMPRMLSPFRPEESAKRLLIAMVVSGLVCLWLARYLTAPVSRLRLAAQQIAEGNLSARAGEGKVRRDEVGELVQEFDHMAERLESLIGAQSRLITDLSHELRSPLARLSVALGLARQQTGPAACAALDRIERESLRLNQMIERLLSLSKLESTELAQKLRVNLALIVEESVADADFEARSRNCKVQAAVEPCQAMGNPELLRSALENVLRNAVKYTAENSTVEVSLKCDKQNDAAWATILVRDHGHGVPENELENLFRPFYRLDSARERQTGGVGLGLAIAQRAVKLHGGSIRAFNSLGNGLTVEIRLPLVAA